MPYIYKIPKYQYRYTEYMRYRFQKKNLIPRSRWKLIWLWFYKAICLCKLNNVASMVNVIVEFQCYNLKLLSVNIGSSSISNRQDWWFTIKYPNFTLITRQSNHNWRCQCKLHLQGVLQRASYCTTAADNQGFKNTFDMW